MRLGSTLATVLIGCACCQGGVLRVRSGVVGGAGDGSSWADAFPNLQDTYSSAAIDVGDNSAVIGADDLAGLPRISHTTVDLGAFEAGDQSYDTDGDGLSDAFELASTSPPSSIALDPQGDPDQDGLSNLLELALGLDSLRREHAMRPRHGTIDHNGLPFLTIAYRRNLWAEHLLDIRVERSTDMGAGDDWSAGETTAIESIRIAPSLNQVTERSNSTISGQPTEFLRIVVTPR